MWPKSMIALPIQSCYAGRLRFLPEREGGPFVRKRTHELAENCLLIPTAGYYHRDK
jgi:hypothetical protein